MEDQYSLSKPLLTTHHTPIRSPQNDGVSPQTNGRFLLRLVFLSSVALLALWATHEASKGFHVEILNALPNGSPASKRFELFYVSNDKATRVLLHASDFVENLLYGADEEAKKPVRHVMVRISGENIPGGVAVKSSGEDFTVELSGELMEAADVDNAVKSAILRGVARVWLWDGDSVAPEEILSGAVESILAAAGFDGGDRLSMVENEIIRCDNYRPDWFSGKDPKFVGRVLGVCEGKDKGFIRRLNAAMRDRWRDRTVGDALGKQVQVCLCAEDKV